MDNAFLTKAGGKRPSVSRTERVCKASMTDLSIAYQDTELESLAQKLYPELRRLARLAMARERDDHTLQSTALVHEAYLRLAEGDPHVQSRAHFLALASRVMRRILIDHARGLERLKRGAEYQRISLTEAQLASQADAYEVLELDRALDDLKAFDERRARLLELQLFGGLAYSEMAETLDVSESTVHRELRLARAWLQRRFDVGGAVDRSKKA